MMNTNLLAVVTPPSIKKNQQAPQLSQDKKNGKTTPLLGLIVPSIAAAALWQLWLENPFFHAKK